MIETHPEGVIISLHVIPSAPKSEIIGEYNNCLKMKIKAPPVDGKANSAIEEFFAEFLGVSKRDVTVLKGEKSKAKKLLIRNLSKDEILHKLSLTPAG